jgi:hypothetical protein
MWRHEEKKKPAGLGDNHSSKPANLYLDPKNMSGRTLGNFALRFPVDHNNPLALLFYF